MTIYQMFKRYKVPFIKGSFRVINLSIRTKPSYFHELGNWVDSWEIPEAKERWLKNLETGLDSLEEAHFPRDMRVHLFYELKSLGIEFFDWGTEPIPIIRNLEGAYDDKTYTLFMKGKCGTRLRITLCFERASVPYGTYIAEVIQ